MNKAQGQEEGRVRSFLLIMVIILFTSCAKAHSGDSLPSQIPQTQAVQSASTPNHTPVPTPTISKTPGVLECSEIVKAHQENTDLQWQGEKILLRGKEYYYSGKVFSVTEHDEVHLTGSLCHATLHQVPHEIAINLTKGQLIEGYGTIKSIGFYRGEDVDIEVNPDLLFVR